MPFARTGRKAVMACPKDTKAAGVKNVVSSHKVKQICPDRSVVPQKLDLSQLYHDEIEAMVASIVAKPAVAVAMGKALFYRQIEVGIEAAYADAGTTMACNMMDPSALEGVQAFIEKRSPNW